MRIPSPRNSPQIRRMESTFPLHDYIYKNDVKNVKASIAESDVNATDSKGRTALLLAASFNRYELIDILLTSGCDVKVADHLGNTPLHEAADKGNTDIVMLLLNHSKCDLNARNNDGETPLMKAAYYDYGDIAKLLLKNGADPDAVDNAGQTALLIALRESSHMTVDHLLKHGCDVSITDKLGHSALYIAIHSTCNKSLDLAKTLLGSGYDISLDKEWLLHEEKHNLFYQDDEFYNRLCRNLTHNDVTNTRIRSYSTKDPTVPSSPALRLRKLATVTNLPPSTSLGPQSVTRKSSNTSPFLTRKVSNTSNGSSPTFSPFTEYFSTPPGSPTLAARKISGTSCGVMESQNEAPMSPITRVRRMTPCPPPTENMLRSPKLRGRASRSCSPLDIKRKTPQTSPTVKSASSPVSPSDSPLSSPESSNPNSPLIQRKSPVTSPLAKAHDDVTMGFDGMGKMSQRFQAKESSAQVEVLSTNCPTNTMPSSPSLRRVIKQGSLDTATPPGSPKSVYRRQINVMFDMEEKDGKTCLKTVQRQVSLPSKNTVQFSADVQIIDFPNK